MLQQLNLLVPRERKSSSRTHHDVIGFGLDRDPVSGSQSTRRTYLLGLSVGRGAAAGTPEPLLPHWAAFLEATVADLTRNQENYYD